MMDDETKSALIHWYLSQLTQPEPPEDILSLLAISIDPQLDLQLDLQLHCRGTQIVPKKRKFCEISDSSEQRAPKRRKLNN
jgi:hypothetical protein